MRPTSVEFISNNGVKPCWSAASALSRTPEPGGGRQRPRQPCQLARLGLGLPNTIVNQIVYNPAVDVLALSLFGAAPGRSMT